MIETVFSSAAENIHGLDLDFLIGVLAGIAFHFINESNREFGAAAVLALHFERLIGWNKVSD